MKLPLAYVGARMPNRIRIYVPEKRKSREYFDKLKRNLSGLSGVRRVEVNAMTGSVLLIHEGNASTICEHSEDLGLFRIDQNSLKPEAWVSKMYREVDKLDGKVRRATDGVFSLSSSAAVVFIGLGGFQIYRKEILPVAAALFLYATQFLAISKNGGGQGRKLRKMKVNYEN